MKLETRRKLAVIRSMGKTHSLREIAAVLGVSFQAVQYFVKTYGIETSSRSDAIKRAWSRPGHREKMLLVPHGRQRKYSTEFCAKVKSMKSHMTARAIAEELKLASRNVVIGIWNRP